MIVRAFLSLGSNLGNRAALLAAAQARLETDGSLRILGRSSLYETAPVGGTEQPWFYNLVIEIETGLSPHDLLARCLGVEHALGRTREERWGPRTVDIDILLYNELTLDTPDLVIPHPELTRRRFVLEPLLEIAPDARLPDGRPLRPYLARVADQSVRRLPNRSLQFRPRRTAQRSLLPEDARGGVYVAVEGPIGVGKTTLARKLAGHLGAEEMLEVVEENPFLHHFYRDIRAYAFQTQIFFFLSRYRQQAAVKTQREQGHAVVSDYVFAKDRLFARMNLDSDELDLYERLYALIAPMTVQPDLVIYLTAGIDTLMHRIAHRDRPFERALERAYLSRLCDEYERLFAEYEETALLAVDTDEVDIFKADDLAEMLRYIAMAST